MFSSLASFLFGSNTNCETNSETTAIATATEVIDERNANTVDADNLIEVTSLTPSVTGAGGPGQQLRAIKRGKNKRNNARQQNKRKGLKNSSNSSSSSNKALSPLTSKQTKLLTPSDSCDEEEFDEDEWFIVEKEADEEDDSPSRSDSEGENVPVIEVVKTTKPITANAASSLAQQRRLQHINSHSLYSGPRPQKQRNYLQKTRNNTNNRSGNGLSVSTLSPSRTVNDGRNGSGQEAKADGGITRSLYVVTATTPQSDEKPLAINTANGLEAITKMDESWFVTPPPCFTSIGPINMETSPYENLLIEHPSMSVYHSIKTAQEAATESFIKLDIGVNDMAEEQKANETTPKKNPQAVQSRSSGSAYRLDRQSVAQLKQELMARNVQKIQTKKERKDICRTAIKRANKVRDVQSRNHTQRRADRQHSKIFSNANNNRKSNCC
ncbi:uncharacterized protein LOC111685992 isoform X1 [Lucilia cuprina]|uniref:uncharacterized protein LOC111685992 isoform X1 n=1 Tax=Lucilia cuprina TaxID=7375 RepID=UPI001F05335C|nr:uncharacterized protein LOC111685992 isoform X1 [Lucilia cuprina]